MTDAEIKAQREHDAKMQKLRAEFAAAWPRIWREMLRTHTVLTKPIAEKAAWLGFMAGVERTPSQ